MITHTYVRLNSFSALRFMTILSLVVAFPADGQTLWRSLGPSLGGTIRLAVTSNGYLFAGTVRGDLGLFRSTDSGESWEKISANYRFFSADGNYLFDGTERQTVIRYSSDFGETWIQRNRPGIDMVQLYFHAGYLFVATQEGLYRSEDLGLSYTRLRSHSYTIETYSFGVGLSPNGTIFTSGNNLYPNTPEENGYRSTDQGQTWTATGYFGYGPSFAFNTLGHVFVGTLDGGLWRSTDNGESWRQVHRALHIVAVATKGANQVFISVYGYGVLRSTDNGENWTEVNNGFVRKGSVNALSITPSGNLFAGSSDAPVYGSTDDGDTWTEAGISNATISTLSCAPSGGLFVTCGFEGSFRSTNREGPLSKITVWPPSVDPFWGPNFFIFPTRSAVLAATRNFIYRSTDGGMTWMELSYFITPTIAGFADQSDLVLVGRQYYISRSTDGGQNWWNVYLNSIGEPRAFAKAIDGSLYAGLLGGVFRSTDNGTSWLPTNAGPASVRSLLFAQNGILLAGTTSGIWRSTDGGSSWSHPFSANLEVKGFAAGQNGPLLAATYGWGILKSEDDGVSWRALIEQPPSLWLNAIAMDADGFVYTGCDRIGIYCSTTPLLSIQNNRQVNPNQFTLEQNYPNPFNPSTKIGFRTGELGFVSLRVYDVLGREVSTLVNEDLQAGSYEAAFDARGLASGVYLYRLQGHNFVQTRKLLLLR